MLKGLHWKGHVEWTWRNALSFCLGIYKDLIGLFYKRIQYEIDFLECLCHLTLWRFGLKIIITLKEFPEFMRKRLENAELAYSEDRK